MINYVELDAYQTTAIQVYEDPEIMSLHFEMKMLERELARLQQLKVEIEQQLNELSRRYRQEVGQFLSELLHLRRIQLAQEADEQPAGETAQAADEEDDPKAERKLRAEKLPELTPAEQQELKDLFRKASKLCHPDVVPAEFRQEAITTFIELKTAYEQNDLNRVKEIFYTLEQSGILTQKSTVITDKDKLYERIDYLSSRIRALHQEIQNIKQSPPYQRLISTEDWDDYFDEIKAKLRREINRLKSKNYGRKRKAPAQV